MATHEPFETYERDGMFYFRNDHMEESSAFADRDMAAFAAMQAEWDEDNLA